jgi:hypothetical protein
MVRGATATLAMKLSEARTAGRGFIQAKSRSLTG